MRDMDRILSGNRVLDEYERITAYFDKISKKNVREMNKYNSAMIKDGKLCGKCVHFDRDKEKFYPDNCKGRYCLIHSVINGHPQKPRKLRSPGCSDFELYVER
jgi:hypothetical protein